MAAVCRWHSLVRLALSCVCHCDCVRHCAQECAELYQRLGTRAEGWNVDIYGAFGPHDRMLQIEGFQVRKAQHHVHKRPHIPAQLTLMRTCAFACMCTAYGRRTAPVALC